MTNSDTDQTDGNGTGMRCLECGAEVPEGASCCPVCGNEKNILPSRWTPPERIFYWKSLLPVFSPETRVLMALSVALICALWLLGSARVRSQAALLGESDKQVEIVRADMAENNRVDFEIAGESVNSVVQGEDPIKIEDARFIAETAQNSGNWFDAVDSWTLVTEKENAEFSDFMSLANAQLMANDAMSSRATLNRAIVRFPDQPEGYLKFGELEESAENLEAARFQYQVGLSYCPGNIDLIEKLHAVETELGYVDEPILEPEVEPEQPEIPGVITTNYGVIYQLQVPVIQPEPSPSPAAAPVNIINPAPPSEPESPQPLNLIGTGNPDVPTTSDPGVDDSNGEIPNVPDEVSITNVQNLQVSATTEQVSLNLVVDNPAAFSTSTASDPTRLIVRIPNAQISEGSSIIRDVNFNVPLVERVHLGEGTSDSGPFVILVIYLGENVHYSVSAESQSVMVRIGKDPGTDAG
ncbi:MAG: AMIN domain-containing protein [bacterium]|nr:AMIN domain-containing protein [bacterium]